MRVPFSFIKGGPPLSPPAAPIAVVPNSGTTAGGTHVVIQVSSSTGLLSAAIDGVNVTGFAIDNGTHVSGNTVADSAGAKNVTVSNAAGASPALVGGYTYVTPFSISSLSVSLWFNSEDYTLAPNTPFAGEETGTWPGTASAGESGNANATASRVDTTGFTVPTVGGTLNGFHSIHFDRTKQQRIEIPNGGALPDGDLGMPRSPHAWLLFAVVNWDSTGCPNNDIMHSYDNSGLLSDPGEHFINFTQRPGFAGNLVNPGSGRVGVEAAAVQGVPQLMMMGATAPTSMCGGPPTIRGSRPRARMSRPYPWFRTSGATPTISPAGAGTETSGASESSRVPTPRKQTARLFAWR